jgi:hypothetical protein
VPLKLYAAAHLKALEAEGIIGHVMFGKRIRFFKYNELSLRAEAVRARFIRSARFTSFSPSILLDDGMIEAGTDFC